MLIRSYRAPRALLTCACSAAILGFAPLAPAQSQPAYYPPQYQAPAPAPQYQGQPQYQPPPQYQQQPAYQPPPQPYPAQPYPPQPYPPQNGYASNGQYGVSWVPGFHGGPTPAGAVYGETESNGDIEDVCRGMWNGANHPGKLANGWCYIAYGSDEMKLPNYEVLVSSSTRWGPPNQYGSTPVIGGRDSKYEYTICRGELFVNGSSSREVGKYLSKGCQVPYGGRAYYIQNFQVLYLR